MFFHEGEKGKYETGAREGVGWEKNEQRVRKKWAHPSIHVLGLWGNLDS